MSEVGEVVGGPAGEGLSAMLNVACVEDVEADAVLIRRELTRSPLMRLENFFRVIDLRSLRRLFSDHPVDVVVLDLGLPDSKGVETIGKAREIVGATPLVVLTGEDHRGVESIALGADDFLAKDDMGGGQLARTLTHAVERRRLVARLTRVENERELERLGAVSIPFGGANDESSAHRLDPGLDDEFLAHAQHAFAAAVSARWLPDGEADLDSMHSIYALSVELADRVVGPEEVVQMLAGAVEAEVDRLSSDQIRPFVRECRLALIELLGHLLRHYRPYVPVDGAVARLDASPDANLASAGVRDDGVRDDGVIVDFKRPPDIV